MCNACDKWAAVGDWTDGCPACGHYNSQPVGKGPMVFGDLPGYQSEVTGKWVEGRSQRREDLKRSGCRPWEGLAQENLQQ